MSQKSTLCLIGLGSNQPWGQYNSSEILMSSIYALHQNNIAILKISRFYQTPCFPTGAGPDYVNAAVMVNSQVDAPSLLEILHLVEKGKDRTRPERWGKRTLDLDLLFFGADILPNLQLYDKWRHLPQDWQRRVAPDRMIVPHPRLQDRSFVLGPLMDIAPDWRHPVLDQSVTQMFSALDQGLREELLPL
jgi:2-amino-4-hydroxy-6-hydroxymethyldihydropteridine diphosphokinase